MDVGGFLLGLAQQFGYLGVFIISLIGAISVAIPIPYTVVIFLLGANPNTNLNPLLIALASGGGAAVGEMVGYGAGYAAGELVGERRKRRMGAMLELLTMRGRWIWPFLIFVFALTPLPDDLLLIPLGLLRYSPWKVLPSMLAGKVLMGYILFEGGRLFNETLRALYGGEGGGFFFDLTLTLSTVALLGVVFWVMWRIDWEGILAKVKRDQPPQK